MHRSPCSWLILVAWLVTLGATPTVAHAQTAESLISEGLAARRRNDDRLAAEYFRRSVDMERTARGLAQLAFAEQALGQWVEAEADLSAALELGGPWIESHRDQFNTELASIQLHIGSLLVFCDVPGAVLSVLGAEHSLPLPRPLRLPIGRTEIEVSAAGYRPVARTVEITVDHVTPETVALTRIRAEAPPPVVEVVPPTPESPVETSPGADIRSDDPERSRDGTGDGLVVGGVVSGLVGLAAIGVGIGLHVRFEDLRANYAAVFDTQCGGADPPPVGAPGYDACLANHQDRALVEPLRNTMFVLGAVAAAGGLAMMIVGATLGGPGDGASTSAFACGPFADIGISCATSF